LTVRKILKCSNLSMLSEKVLYHHNLMKIATRMVTQRTSKAMTNNNR
jgi:hypothetical protein